MTQSQTALRNNINNEPNTEQIENLKQLCKNILQPTKMILIQDGFIVPLRPTEGRNP
jgi:hypothetical protein